MYPMGMGEWDKKVFKLPKNHGWKARPENKIFVADRGAVRFDYPASWVVIPGEDSIRFHDRQPPDDNCRLQVSYMRLPTEVDWSKLSLAELLEQAVQADERTILSKGEVVRIERPDLELVWTELAFEDTNEHREARSRICLGRGSNIQPLITMEFWPEDAGRFGPVWDELLRSLQLGNYVANPFGRTM